MEALRRIADEKQATPSQLAIAWALSRGHDVVPVGGARKRVQLQEALGAVDLRLSAEALARIEAAVPREQVSGARMDPTQMAHLDSERNG